MAGPRSREQEQEAGGTVNEDECELCGEDADAEMGIFWDPNTNNGVWAHAQCGVDGGLDLA